MGEDEFLVPGRVVFPDARSRERQRQQQPGLRKLLQPLAVALGIFGVSAGAARYLFPRKKLQPQQLLQTAGHHDLLDSHTTSDCSTPTKIVMQGADLTSYFSLEPGAAPLFGVAEHESVFNGYTFWFASEENKAMFEVCTDIRWVYPAFFQFAAMSNESLTARGAQGCSLVSRSCALSVQRNGV